MDEGGISPDGDSGLRSGAGTYAAGPSPGQRVVGLAGSPNFRDAGGYAAGPDGRMHWGRLFRSGHLACLTEEDRERLAALGLDLVIDLRRADERDLEPSALPGGIAVHGAAITPGSQASAIYADSMQLGGAGAMFEFMCDINREFVRSQTETYREAFAALLDSGAERVLVHCSAGKDRTGFAIAMLQCALGVAVEDIRADYLLSRRYFLPEEQLDPLRAKYAVDHLSDEDLLPMMHADPAYLQAAFAAIDESWESRDAYLRHGLGLADAERRELRRRFVRGR
ncbi:MAG: tyrosine-protein phosphatase [Halieaceae bacterium]|jgi:protein-tyrosine phosphatase|nr:tyrosine-protein phosphatase [Halieaceae bacterium]